MKVYLAEYNSNSKSTKKIENKYKGEKDILLIFDGEYSKTKITFGRVDYKTAIKKKYQMMGLLNDVIEIISENINDTEGLYNVLNTITDMSLALMKPELGLLLKEIVLEILKSRTNKKD